VTTTIGTDTAAPAAAGLAAKPTPPGAAALDRTGAAGGPEWETPACAGPAPRVGDGEALTIAEVADRLGVSAHTLRYYERIGLVSVPRDEAGHRVYGPEEVSRIVFITRLRLTAMPIRDIQAYFRLVAEGPGNEGQRLALLERHRDEVKARLVDLESALGVIEFKIATYGGACAP
jgi:DNA-binding transcriptional MerR regulator